MRPGMWEVGSFMSQWVRWGAGVAPSDSGHLGPGWSYLHALGLHFPTCKTGLGVPRTLTADSVSTFAQQGPVGRAAKGTMSTQPWPAVGVSPSPWQWLLPGLCAAHLRLCGRLCPKHPSLLKPHSRGRPRAGEGAVPGTGVEIEAAAAWLTSFRLSRLLPPGLGCSERGASGIPEAVCHCCPSAAVSQSS